MEDMKKIALVLVLAFLLVGCSGSIGLEEINPQFDFLDGRRTYLKDDGGTFAFRFVDQEAGVACWVVGGGLSCLPLSETLLDR
jgi:hypothetical protein